ncbi:potassium transporter TrkA [Streptomyces venezuelae]|uniref:CASTOR/POLLUX-related putative ion channel n=1 Tax=Streptomyces venezuelae TaxID=54571 RepID=UPI00123CBAF2|nr:potassium transporter TrkA [Streptomyces venezuelae]QES13276.1 potassium transporter TrkA [Streptomyces venezuelae]
MLQRFRYRIDTLMGRGAPALFLVLAALCCVLALLNGLMLLLFAPEDIRPRGARSSLWAGLLRVMSPALLLRDRGPAPFLGLTVVMAFSGVVLMSTIVPVISTGLHNQLARLRAGRSLVLESGHTVILGWSPQIHVVVAELVEANRGRRHACIAVLAEKDRTEMEVEIRERIATLAGTRVVCRTGSPADPQDVSLVNPQQARSVIVLPSEEKRPDLGVIKSLLAVARTRQGPDTGPYVVAGIEDHQNLAAARLAGGSRCRVISTQGFIARLMVHSSLQSGLSNVYTELLDFADHEIYMSHQPALTGLRFDDTLRAFRASAVIGLMRPDGHILMNPPGDTRIGPDDRIVLISESAATISLVPDVPELPAVSYAPVPDVAERGRSVLVLGCNQHLADIVEQFDAHLPAGSRVHVVTGEPAPIGNGSEGGLELTVQQADTTRRRVLESLLVEKYDHVMVLSPDGQDPQGADAGTLTTLLNLRDLAQDSPAPYTLVTEMADDRNRVLAQAARPDDLIVSANLLSLRLSQISENPHLDRIFDELFAPSGCQIMLRPATHYVPPWRPVTFGTVVEAVRRQGHLAIGHRLAHRVGEPPHHGIALNPDKETPLVYSPDDCIVILTSSSVIPPDHAP